VDGNLICSLQVAQFGKENIVLRTEVDRGFTAEIFSMHPMSFCKLCDKGR
jgi:hypothetical protein